MFLREYLYVDLDKVSGLASQLYDGIPEKATNLTARQKSLETNLKLFRGGSGSSSEDAVVKSLGDSLFKDLETDLESLGLLRDVSDQLSQDSAWKVIQSLASPGRILRITAPGTLFHSAQVSDTLVGIATAAHGLADLSLGPQEGAISSTQHVQTKGEPRKPPAHNLPQPVPEPGFPEDTLPPGEYVPFLNLPRKQLSGMIRLVRGIFGEGVHLHLRPLGPDGPVVSARLEEGRRFLDSSPEVLISRYGLAEQEWTIVGIVGQLGSQTNPGATTNTANADGSLNRAQFVDSVRNFFDETLGLVDLPKFPGFSIVPLALYRGIGNGLQDQ